MKSNAFSPSIPPSAGSVKSATETPDSHRNPIRASVTCALVLLGMGVGGMSCGGDASPYTYR